MLCQSVSESQAGPHHLFYAAEGLLPGLEWHRTEQRKQGGSKDWCGNRFNRCCVRLGKVGDLDKALQVAATIKVPFPCPFLTLPWLNILL